jgi:hypothetical protein
MKRQVQKNFIDCWRFEGFWRQNTAKVLHGTILRKNPRQMPLHAESMVTKSHLKDYF